MRQLITTLFILSIYSLSNAQFTAHLFNYSDDDYPFINEIQLADMNGDGDLDYVTLGHQNRTISVAYHNDFNTPNLDTLIAPESIRNLRLYDFDQDGDVDIIGSAPFASMSFWWNNEGNGIYTIQTFPIADYNSLLFADMNNDDVIDMVANVDDALRVYNYNAAVVSLREEVDMSTFSLVLKGLTTFDKDGDGFPEIVASDAFDGILLYEQSTADNFTRIDLLPEVFSVEKVEISDLNNDGHFDIIASSEFNGSCKIQINQGDDTFIEDKIPATVSGIYASNLIDYDGDGDGDVLYIDGGFGENGKTFVYQNQGSSFSAIELFEEYTRVEAIAVGDIDGDGDTDAVMGENPFFDTNLIVLENDGEINCVLNVDVGPDLNITSGESVQLTAAISSPIEVVTISWSPSIGLSCDDCADPIAMPLENTCYTVTATDILGCVETDEICIDVAPSSTKQIETTTYEVYPTISTVDISLFTNELLNYSLINQEGKLIETGASIGIKTFSIEGLAPGMYFLRLQKGREQITEKVLVAR